MTKNNRTIGSVQRALDILGLFNSSHLELGITEIANALNLHKSTASGLIYTLEDNYYLEQNPENRKYRLGLKLLERSSIVLGGLDIRHVALPYLQELRDWSQESINLAILDTNEVVYVERVSSEQNFAFINEVGKRGWVHSTALGKAIIAHLPNEQTLDILNSYELHAFTPYTMINIHEIMDDLVLTRERGFALDNQENELGGRCVAAPIHNHHGDPIAAISISVPLLRIPTERITYFGNKVRDVAAQISARLGYQLAT